MGVYRLQQLRKTSWTSSYVWATSLLFLTRVSLSIILGWILSRSHKNNALFCTYGRGSIIFAALPRPFHRVPRSLSSIFWPTHTKAFVCIKIPELFAHVRTCPKVIKICTTPTYNLLIPQQMCPLLNYESICSHYWCL